LTGDSLVSCSRDPSVGLVVVVWRGGGRRCTGRAVSDAREASKVSRELVCVVNRRSSAQDKNRQAGTTQEGGGERKVRDTQGGMRVGKGGGEPGAVRKKEKEA